MGLGCHLGVEQGERKGREIKKLRGNLVVPVDEQVNE